MLGSFEYAVLESISRQPRDAYGATIQSRVSEKVGREASFGAVYTTLSRLEAKGLVSSRWGEATPERGGRRKRLYAITANGQRALHDTEQFFGHAAALGAEA